MKNVKEKNVKFILVEENLPYDIMKNIEKFIGKNHIKSVSKNEDEDEIVYTVYMKDGFAIERDGWKKLFGKYNGYLSFVKNKVKIIFMGE